ncbi:MAG TPA: cytochrome c peroxidase [Casimicrobiaceae bacterium]|nr:cytochrome c peroxidase [Casimicrobiaceae bacterium]
MTALSIAVGAVALAWAQAIDPATPPSLKTVRVADPPNLYDYVANKAAAIALGKALFWDMQVGSDGVVACASCHFHAGADSRSANQLNPGSFRRDANGQPAPDRTFDLGANFQLTPSHFPLRQLANPMDRASGSVRDSNDIVASQGIFNATFVAVTPGSPEEAVTRPPDPDGFSVGGLNVRRVERRHTPSVINAVFNDRNFWDGRAQNVFNGVNQWGDRDPDARVYRADAGGVLSRVPVRLVNSSLASQAVAPLVSAFEMSADGRSVADLGNKLLKKKGEKLQSIRPLAKQVVHKEDSVLGPLSRSPSPGLVVTSYESAIKVAFRREWWSSKSIIRVGPSGGISVIRGSGGHDGDEDDDDDDEQGPQPVAGSDDYSQMAYNFPLFFGIAVQLYQATLISDDTPFDRWREGRGTLSPQALIGLEVFLGQQAVTLADGSRRAGARCINCHAGAEFTDASIASVLSKGETRNREGQDLDRGYNNIGVRPAFEDLGVGARDAFGSWLSVTRIAPKSLQFIAVDGAFKVPGLRNVELTAPYFHNGGYLTLESLVEFYNRGGDFGPLQAINGSEIRPLSVPMMSAAEQAGMVAFLKSLTDDRVRYRRAPFDHPQLFVPDGQQNNHLTAVEDPVRPGQARDRMREIPAVGRNGGPPLPNFLGLP